MSDPDKLLDRLAVLDLEIRGKADATDDQIEAAGLVRVRARDLRRAMDNVEEATLDAEAAIAIAEGLLARRTTS